MRHVMLAQHGMSQEQSVGSVTLTNQSTAQFRTRKATMMAGEAAGEAALRSCSLLSVWNVDPSEGRSFPGSPRKR